MLEQLDSCFSLPTTLKCSLCFLQNYPRIYPVEQHMLPAPCVHFLLAILLSAKFYRANKDRKIHCSLLGCKAAWKLLHSLLREIPTTVKTCCSSAGALAGGGKAKARGHNKDSCRRKKTSSGVVECISAFGKRRHHFVFCQLTLHF